MKNRKYSETLGTWFVAYGGVYSLLDDGRVVGVTPMNRDELGTWPVERDTNCHYIVKLQNDDVGRELVGMVLEEAVEKIDA